MTKNLIVFAIFLLTLLCAQDLIKTSKLLK